MYEQAAARRSVPPGDAAATAGCGRTRAGVTHEHETLAVAAESDCWFSTRVRQDDVGSLLVRIQRSLHSSKTGALAALPGADLPVAPDGGCSRHSVALAVEHVQATVGRDRLLDALGVLD